MSNYQAEVLVGDEYKVIPGQTSRTVIEFGGPRVPSPVQKMQDLMRPGRDSYVSDDKCLVNMTNNNFDGYDFSGAAYTPTALMDYAECNWRVDTLQPYAGSYILNQTGPGGQAKGFDFTTIVDGSYCCFGVSAFGGLYGDQRVWIDDEPVGNYRIEGGAVQKSLDGFMNFPGAGTVFTNLKFQRRGSYKLRVAGIPHVGNAGGMFALNVNGTIRKPAPSKTFGFISDSFGEASSNTYDTVPANIAHLTGWRQWNMSEGGTGMANPGLVGGVDHSYGSDAVFDMLSKAPELEVLIVNGSCNDLGYSTEVVKQKMRDLFDRIRMVRPYQKIFWVGLEPTNYFRNLYPDSVILARENALAEVALLDPNVVGIARPYAEKWLTGSGYTTAQNSSGNQDALIGQDGIHLAPGVGPRHYARLIVERLKPCPAYIRSAA